MKTQFLFYDHLLTFADEVQYIWSAKHSFPKFLFLLVRYLVPAALIVHLYREHTDPFRRF